ncbi:MAG: imidazole glycerol phosphate synthase subunit HisH [Chloroflexi bacterium]|nr:imidazole glycerol phosphate synthase subunit HisH [Chloroflexota bacterium]
MGNIDSVGRAIEECGGQPILTDQLKDIAAATHLILPGVGSFCDGITNIKERHLDEILHEQVFQHQIPFLGICLGMQLLAEVGKEGDTTTGLGWIEGEVCRLEATVEDTRIPHIGWNEVLITRESPLFSHIPSGQDFYFVHSYHLRCRNVDNILAYTPYCGQFVSALNRDWIFGTQFHPEKSQKAGFQVLKNFLAL